MITAQDSKEGKEIRGWKDRGITAFVDPFVLSPRPRRRGRGVQESG